MPFETCQEVDNQIYHEQQVQRPKQDLFMCDVTIISLAGTIVISFFDKDDNNFKSSSLNWIKLDVLLNMFTSRDYFNYAGALNGPEPGADPGFPVGGGVNVRFCQIFQNTA